MNKSILLPAIFHSHNFSSHNFSFCTAFDLQRDNGKINISVVQIVFTGREAPKGLLAAASKVGWLTINHYDSFSSLAELQSLSSLGISQEVGQYPQLKCFSAQFIRNKLYCQFLLVEEENSGIRWLKQ